ncbi:MAG TPA: peptide deformylase [Actinomycetota bacterium]
MGSLDIRIWGDPVLRTKAQPVEAFDDALRRLADDMLETMRAAPGVGLAAPQVGVDRRLFVFDSGERSGAMCNPAVTWASEETQESEEGCLSIPEVYFPVVRAMHVRVEARDVHGNSIVEEVSGFEARIFQHEIDHLDGILFVDRLDDETRKEAMRAIRDMLLGEHPHGGPRPARAL